MLSYFEGGRLEAEVLRRAGEHEAVVDVYEMALVVEQDVAVVAVFDLEQVAGDRVAGAALDKVLLRGQELLAHARLPELLQEVVEQRQWLDLAAR